MLKSRMMTSRTMSCGLLCCGIGLLVMSIPDSARAQSLFGNSGALSNTSGSAGSASRGGSSSGARSGSTSGSSSSMFGNTSGSGGSRSGASTGIGTGTSSMAQPTLNMGDGSLGATIGTSGFVGRGDNAGRFVGSQNAGRQGVNNAAQMFSQLQALSNRNNNQNTNRNSSVRQPITPQVRVGFEHPLQLDSSVNTQIQTQLVELPGVGSRAAGVIPQMDSSGVMTLSGTVATEEDRRMMEILTRMEPGVREVKNELRVVAP